MSSTQKAELLGLLSELMERYPHWRMGQLLTNLTGWADQNIWDVEDEQLIEAAKTHLAHAADQTVQNQFVP